MGGSTRVGRSAMDSILLREVSPALAKFFQYRENFARRPLQVVVYHHVRSDFTSFRQFEWGTREPSRHVVLVITSAPQAPFELFIRRRLNQKHGGVRVLASHLLSPLDFDLQEDIGPTWCVGDRCPVEISLELGPFKEAAIVDSALECAAVNEVVLRAILGLTLRARGPAAAEPEPGVLGDETSSNSPLANTTRPNEYHDERLSGQGLERVLRAA